MDNLEEKVKSLLDSPDGMAQILSVARSLTDSPDTAQASDAEKPASDDKRLVLLNALRPFLKSEDAVHVDKAIQIMRLSKVAKNIFFTKPGGDAHV
ncbi:MAG: hypothetical protein RSC43_02365 [Clostridia bacterium]